MQASVCDYMTTAYDVHVELLRAELAERRSIAFAAIEQYWPCTMRLARSGGGYYLWATASRDVRARALLDASERNGASFLFGEAFFASSGGDHNFRLALTPVDKSLIAEGIKRIGAALS